jgi:sensor domain CHASE-containing protein
MDERIIVPILSKFRHFSMLLQFILKTIVYRTAPNSEQELRQRILNAAQTITPQMLRNVQGSIRRRLGKCIEANGQNFEHLL